MARTIEISRSPIEKIAEGSGRVERERRWGEEGERRRGEREGRQGERERRRGEEEKTEREREKTGREEREKTWRGERKKTGGGRKKGNSRGQKNPREYIPHLQRRPRRTGGEAREASSQPPRYLHRVCGPG